MVVVSHLFFFLWKKLVRGAAHMSRPSHYLELSISRQPPLMRFRKTPIMLRVMQKELFLSLLPPSGLELTLCLLHRMLMQSQILLHKVC